MAIAYTPISSIDDIDTQLNVYATKVINFFYIVVKGTVRIAGYLGIVVLTIILLPIAPFIHLYLRQVNSRIRSDFEGIYNWINNASESDLRYAHLGVERKNHVFKDLLKKQKIVDKNIITMGISSQANLLIQQFLNLEDSLKKAAYPHFDDKLSDEDIEELKLTFAGASID